MVSDSDSSVVDNKNDLLDVSLLVPSLEDVEILKAADSIIPPSSIKVSNGITSRSMAKGVAATADAVFQPFGSSYIMCSSCKTAYVMSEEEIGKGKRVQCGVCEKEWFQSTDRLLKIGNENQIYNMTEGKITEIKRMINDHQWPKFPKIDRFGVFVGNLPYTYGEKELSDLFAEYGVTGISLVKDAEQNSKGFAFVEVATQEDADLMIKEMHHFHTDNQRKLTVRLAEPPGSGRGGGGADRGGQSGAPQGGGPQGGSGGARAAWTPRNK